MGVKAIWFPLVSPTQEILVVNKQDDAISDIIKTG